MVQALWWLCRAERDLDPARHPGRCRVVLRDHHRHGPGRLTRRRCCEPLAPNEELARVQTVAPGHRRDRGRRVEALGHDPGLLLVGPAPAPADAGDHLDAAEAVVVRTGDTTIITHRSRARSCRLGPSSSSSSADPQGAPLTTVTGGLPVLVGRHVAEEAELPGPFEPPAAVARHHLAVYVAGLRR